MNRKGWVKTISDKIDLASYGAEHEFKVKPNTTVIVVCGGKEYQYGEDGNGIRTRFSFWNGR